MYLDQHARVLHSSFLLYLTHDRCLGVAGGRRHAAERVHVFNLVCLLLWRWVGVCYGEFGGRGWLRLEKLSTSRAALSLA